MLLLAFQSSSLNCQALGSDTSGFTTTAQNPSSAAPATPVTLYGRIDELVEQAGATLPNHLQELTPILDRTPTQASAESKPLSGHIIRSFPMEWEGNWNGDVTVVKREHLASSWLLDPVAAYRECQGFKVGSKGTLSCIFSRDGGNLALSPPIFRTHLKIVPDLEQAVLAQYAGEIQSPGGDDLLLLPNDGKSPPKDFRLKYSLGQRSGPDIGDNFGYALVLSNQLRELAPGVIEQDIVVATSSVNLQTGGPASAGKEESVVRLSRQGDKLQVSAATVTYHSDGQCSRKIILDGVLERVGD